MADVTKYHETNQYGSVDTMYRLPTTKDFRGRTFSTIIVHTQLRPLITTAEYHQVVYGLNEIQKVASKRLRNVFVSLVILCGFILCAIPWFTADNILFMLLIQLAVLFVFFILLFCFMFRHRRSLASAYRAKIDEQNQKVLLSKGLEILYDPLNEKRACDGGEQFVYIRMLSSA